MPTGPERDANVELLNAFADALDTRDWTRLASLLTEDFVFTACPLREDGTIGPAMQTSPSRGAMIESTRGLVTLLRGTHHMLSNHAVTAAADGLSATGSCYVRAHHAGNRERSHLFQESLGRFDVETVVEDGRWKLRRMREVIFVSHGSNEVFRPAP